MRFGPKHWFWVGITAIFVALVVSVFVAPRSHIVKASAGPMISNPQATNITTTTATITWTTDVPSTSQVIQVDNSDYSTAYKRFPEPLDNTLTTSHSVTMSNLVPDTEYTVYEASEDSNGNIGDTRDANPSAASSYTIFTTSAVDATASTTYRIDTIGPQNVYAGSDLYFTFNPVVLSGALGGSWFTPAAQVSGLPSSITSEVMCSFIDPTNPGADSWNGNCQMPGTGTMRLRTMSNTPVGSYVATFTAQDGNGVAETYSYPFNVVAAPGPTVRSAPTSIPPIPDLALWQSDMTQLGTKWCAYDAAHPAISLGYQADDWYYDGGRVFLQMADYTGDYAQWVPCAERILSEYGTIVNNNAGQIQLYEKFPYGLAMNYLRYGDQTSKQAVINLDTTATLAGDFGYGTLANPYYMRELSYAIDSMVAGQEIGQPQSVWLPIAVNAALNQIDEDYVSDPWQFDQPFYGGLMAEALITYYDNVSPDPRIPPAIKTMLDWYWNNAVNHTTGQTDYNPLYVPSYTFYDLNDLFDPAYAWYWNLTGNNTYQQEGDLLFQSDLTTDANDDITYDGKIFSQTYKWSFDYVRWRSGINNSTIDAASNPALIARTTPPVISSVVTTGLTNNAVIVDWNTDEKADTLINYGLTASYTASTTLVSDLVTSHGQAITGLSPNTTYHYQIQSTDGWGNVARSPDYTFTTTSVAIPDASFTPIRINAGGGQYTDTQGNVWSADTDYTGGISMFGNNLYYGDIADTALYATMRGGNGSTFQYQFNVPNGAYYVGMKFAETQYSAAQRTFSITINGATVASNFLLTPILTSIDETYLGVVTNGTLTLNFTPGSADAVVSAIQIIKASTASAPASSGSSSPPPPSPPTLSLTSPAPGATVAGTSVLISASAQSSSTITKVEFYVDSSLVGTDTTSPYSFALDTTSLANGNHTLTAKAYDSAGNITTSSGVTVSVNNIVSPPAPTSTVPQTLSVSFLASPTSGISPLPVSLTATVGGTAQGTVNYIFYCNRADAGTNITSPANLTMSNVIALHYTASNICTYNTPGTYTAKVIVQQGTAAPAQAQVQVVVTNPPVIPIIPIVPSAPTTPTTPTKPTTPVMPIAPSAPSTPAVPIIPATPTGFRITSVIVSQVTANSAVVTITANAHASFKGRYGPTTAYGATTNATTYLTTAYLNLTGLTPDTTYDLDVVAEPETDSNSFIDSTNYVFSTKAAASGISISTVTPASSVTFARAFAYGDRGEDVLLLQTILQSLGYLPSSFTPTMLFGATTQHALLLFQRDHQVNRSGYLDIQSRALFNKIVAANPSLLGGVPFSVAIAANTTASSTAQFAIGAHVEALSQLRVHAKASALSSVMGTQGIGAFGTIIGGPVAAQGYTWWQVNYDLGVSGWSAQTFLNVIP